MIKPEDVPKNYELIPNNWHKWTRITQYLDTGEITWAFGWNGHCYGSGKAGSWEHAQSCIRRKSTATLLEFRCQVDNYWRRERLRGEVPDPRTVVR